MSGLQPEGVPGERVASRFIVTNVNEDVLLKAAPESHKKASSGQAQQEKEKLVKDLNRAIIVKKSVGSSGSTGKRKEKKKHIPKMSDQQAGVLEADDVSKLTVRKPEETEENVLLKAGPPSQNEASSDETQPEMEKLLKKTNQESISIAIEELPEQNVLVTSPESDQDDNTHATTKWRKIRKLNKFIPKKMATYIVLLYSFMTGIAVGLSVITNYVSLNKDFWIDVIYGCELLVSSVTGSLLSTVTMDNVKPAKTMTVASVISTIGLSVQMYGPMATFQHVGLLITGFGLGFGSFTSFFWIKGKPITIIFCIINILLFMATGLLASYYANLGFSILCFCDVILTIMVKWYTTELKKARNGQRPTHREDATEV
ncbi:uncharacterized protein LOC134529960 [Bacillus rossius redtenbacheri]|uniref:uncharacterized protein LOC134529960 n=1 Tax=Bacillus rossius redtenbacheri TaxID=93214 RepID=UPI002FDDF46F